MPKKRILKPDEMIFCEAVAMGKTYKAAAELAGMKGYKDNQYLIARRPLLKEYIERLQQEMKGKYSKYLEEAIPILLQKAYDQGTVNGLARAIELIARINGDFREPVKKEEGPTGQNIIINYVTPKEDGQL